RLYSLILRNIDFLNLERMISYSSGVNRVFIHRVRLLGIFLILILINNPTSEAYRRKATDFGGCCKKTVCDTNVHLADCRKRRDLPSKTFDSKGSSASICFVDMVDFFAFATSSLMPSLASS